MTPGRFSRDGTPDRLMRAVQAEIAYLRSVSRRNGGDPEPSLNLDGSLSTGRSKVDRPTDFVVDVAPNRDHVVVAPVGELDMATVPQLREAIEDLLDQRWDHLVVDLTGVTFIDSTGLELLLREEGQTSGSFELIVPPGQVERAIELTGLRDHFAIRDKRPDS